MQYSLLAHKFRAELVEVVSTEEHPGIGGETDPVAWNHLCNWR